MREKFESDLICPIEKSKFIKINKLILFLKIMGIELWVQNKTTHANDINLSRMT